MRTSQRYLNIVAFVTITKKGTNLDIHQQMNRKILVIRRSKKSEKQPRMLISHCAQNSLLTFTVLNGIELRDGQQRCN